MVDGDDLTGVANDLAPAQGDARLDGDPGGAGRQHLLPVGGVLLGEPLQAGGGDHPGGGALLLKDVPGGHGHPDLGAGGDQDDLGGRLALIGVGGLGQDVGAAAHALGGSGSGGVHGEVLTRQGDAGRLIVTAQDLRPGRGGLVGVPWAHHGQAGDGAQCRQVLDRLVGGAVLTDSDGVVGPHEDRTDPHERRQAHGRAHVVGEHHEGAPVGAGEPVQGDPVEDRAHGVLAHTEVEGAPEGPIALGLRQRGGQEGGLAGHGRVVRAGQVRRPAPQLGHHAGQGGEHLARRRTGGQGLTHLPGRQSRLKALGQAVGLKALQQRGTGGVGPLPGREALLPARSGGPGVVGGPCAGVGDDVLGKDEALLGIQAQGPLEPGDLLGPELGAVGGGLALLGRGGPGDERVQADQRRARALGAGRHDGLVQRLEVLRVAVGAGAPVDVEHLPAVGLEAGRDVLGEGDVRVALDGDVVVVVDGDEVAQLLGAGQGGGLRGHALLHAAVAQDRVDEVVEDRLTQRGAGVEQPVLAARRHRQAHRVGETRPQRARGGLHPGNLTELGVTRQAGRGAEGREALQVNVVAGQEQLDVLHQRGVPDGQDEPVASQPARIRRVVDHLTLVEQPRHSRQRDRRTGVPRPRLLHGVSGQGLGHRDGLTVEVGEQRLSAHNGGLLVHEGASCPWPRAP